MRNPAKLYQLKSLQAFRGRISTLAHLMSRICINMGDSVKIRFYELDNESKMRLLKTQSHTSNGLAMGARNTRRKAVEGSAGPTTRHKPPIKNLPRTAGVAGRGRKGSRTCRIPPVCRGGAGKALRQTNHRRVTMARRTLVDIEHGNTGANTRESSCANLSREIGMAGS